MNDRERILGNLPSSEVRNVPDAPVRVFQGDKIAQFRERCEELGVEIIETGEPGPMTDPWTAEVGYSEALLAIAETGAVWLDASEPRLNSVAPPVHIVRVRTSTIVATLEDALQQGSSRTSVLIAGPSRTADIEGVLVRGVHGPHQVIVVLTE